MSDITHANGRNRERGSMELPLGDRQSRVALLGHRIQNDGYGYAIIQIGDAMQRIDPRAAVVDMSNGDERFASHEMQWLIGGTAVALCTPDWLPQITADRLIAFTMFESTRIPRDWPALLNSRAERLLVPSEWCRTVFADNGVSIPIEVVRLGINPDHYPYIVREPRSTYTFLWSGTADQRKGWDIVYRSFVKAFGARDDVRLHLHFRDALPGEPRFGDPNVRVMIGRVQRSMLLSLFGEADAFVFPSRGEGWGSPPREAASTGLPVAVTDAGGLAEERPSWAFGIGVSRMTPAAYGVWRSGEIGEWFEPDGDALTEWMINVERYRDKAKQFGERASRWLHTNATWDRTARQLLALEGVTHETSV